MFQFHIYLLCLNSHLSYSIGALFGHCETSRSFVDTSSPLLGISPALAVDCSFSSSYPRQLVTYALASTDTITVDGRLEEEAWRQVEWSQHFADIRSVG